MSKKQKKIPEKGEKKKKAIHDSEYIAYCEHGDSAAVFIMRDIQNTVNVKGKWIDVLSIKTRAENVIKSGWHDFEYFEVELFPKRILPEYKEHMTEDEKHYLTWQTAKFDIMTQRNKGYKGKKYRVYPYIDVKYVREERTRVTDIILEMFDPNKNEWVNCGHGPVPNGCEYRSIKKSEKVEVVKEIRKYKVRKVERI